MPADAPIIEFNQVRKVLTFPAAIGSAPLAAQEDAVEIAHLQDCLLRTVGNLLDPQRKSMKVEQQLSVAHQSPAGNVGIAKHHAAASVFRCEGADEGKQA